MTFRVTSLLGIQQRWASLQRAPVAGVPCLLALSKSSLNGVLGGQVHHLAESQKRGVSAGRRRLNKFLGQ